MGFINKLDTREKGRPYWFPFLLITECYILINIPGSGNPFLLVPSLPLNHPCPLLPPNPKGGLLLAALRVREKGEERGRSGATRKKWVHFVQLSSVATRKKWVHLVQLSSVALKQWVYLVQLSSGATRGQWVYLVQLSSGAIWEH